MFYCIEHAKARGWPWPEDTQTAFTIPPTSYGQCELCRISDPPDKTAKVCADVPSSSLP